MIEVRYRCPECGATHVRPRHIEGEPPRRHENTCIAPHSMRDAGFEGCGNDVNLIAIAYRADDGGEWINLEEKGIDVQAATEVEE